MQVSKKLLDGQLKGQHGIPAAHTADLGRLLVMLELAEDGRPSPDAAFS